ncbi:unnamed protein product [Mycena citricolor]|uniref:NAD-dependent epimerase/dehydratase domain-containing protein n=1 Tax=Mycena citricolor TaxID=2018698 RepID=A0AAD2H301_9AGAR|nr:unnamed protein product [Mycena citricolor]
MPTLQSGKVLVSGANGYIAVWVVRFFLEEGYSVRGTVRSADKGTHLVELFKSYGDKLEVVVVPDITADGAFDEAVKGVDAIAHTASPFHFQVHEPSELIGPAVNGTLGILKSALKCGENVRRVVVTASTATVLTANLPTQTVFSEKDWNERAIEQVEKLGVEASAGDKYCASKTLAERAAWNFMKEHPEAKFDLTVLNPPLVLGPDIQGVSSPSELNTSSKAMYRGLTDPAALVDGAPFIDVRDIALAHVRAVQREEAGGERIIVVADKPYTWQDCLDALPAAAVASGKYQKGKPGTGKDVPQNILYDNSKGKRILGIKYHSLEEMTAATVEQQTAFTASENRTTDEYPFSGEQNCELFYARYGSPKCPHFDCSRQGDPRVPARITDNDLASMPKELDSLYSLPEMASEVLPSKGTDEGCPLTRVLSLMSSLTELDESSVVWGSRVLISAAVLFFNDFLLTLPQEVRFHEKRRNRHVSGTVFFILLRYIPVLYHLAVIIPICRDVWTVQVRMYKSSRLSPLTQTLTRPWSCAIWDSIGLSFDSAFQMIYVCIISWRIFIISGKPVGAVALVVGLLPSIINVALPNPSVFPQCRAINPSDTSRIILFVPCLRAIFDAFTTIVLFFTFWKRSRAIRDLPGLSTGGLVEYLMEEGECSAVCPYTVDENSEQKSRISCAFPPLILLSKLRTILITSLIFVIMAMEATFFQIPSARNHARNFIAPYVDALTPLLATRFILELPMRSQETAETRMSAVSRTYFERYGSERNTKGLYSTDGDEGESADFGTTTIRPGDSAVHLPDVSSYRGSDLSRSTTVQSAVA